jgi:hypothetical protein
MREKPERVPRRKQKRFGASDSVSMMRRTAGAALAALLFVVAPCARALDLDLEHAHYFLQSTIKTWHFHPKPDHDNHQHLLNLEVIDPSDWLAGAAYFDNSFDQATRYFYVGKRWWTDIHGVPTYFKLTGGLLHGYKGEYRDEIPFNTTGTAPVVIPAFGIRYERFGSEVILFGTAGAMVTVGYEF